MTPTRLWTIVGLLTGLLAPLAAHAADDVTPWSRGVSGELEAALALPGQALPVPDEAAGARWYRWTPEDAHGAATRGAPLRESVTAPAEVGIWRLELSSDQDGPWHAWAMKLVVRREHDPRSPYLNGYHVGRHPGIGRTGRYTPPEAFIEVTPRNQDFRVSEHFTLAQFLTHDQRDVWPKYVPLDLRLVDKLELLLQRLHALGYPAKRLHVMSGYRTPEYNGPGGNGRVRLSRHTYGDAADVWLDDDGDGRMDDLNHDGKVTAADAALLARVAAQVEQRAPGLSGGIGFYRATHAHGPFAHIDVRGRAARWSSR